MVDTKWIRRIKETWKKLEGGNRSKVVIDFGAKFTMVNSKQEETLPDH